MLTIKTCSRAVSEPKYKEGYRLTLKVLKIGVKERP